MVMEISFDHLGLKTKKKKEGESWVESTRVWVTNPKEHPFNVEWLRYEPDSPVPKEVQERPHIAYRVSSIEESVKGLRTLIEPFEVGGFLKVGFYEYKDGTIVELMEYLKDPDQWFPDEA
jgi:hypothetical protein